MSTVPESVRTLKSKTGRTRGRRRVQQVSASDIRARRERAERIAQTELAYVYHASFDERGANRRILHEPPASEEGERARPRGRVDSYMARLLEVPLLTQPEEKFLFRKMNYLKHLAERLRRQLKPARATDEQLDRIEDLQRAALAVRNRIIEANLRLVFSIAKRYAMIGSSAFDDFVSEGHLTIVRAIDKFDFSRDVRFSTYATWSLLNGCNALAKKEGKLVRRQAPDEVDSLAESELDHRTSYEQELSLDRVRKTMGRLLLDLDARERTIISARFGFRGGRAPTLRQLGQELGVSKERVRQLQERALQKLRGLAGDAYAELLDARAKGERPKKPVTRPHVKSTEEFG
jgi:RNA polymerase primary sigma factor